MTPPIQKRATSLLQRAHAVLTHVTQSEVLRDSALLEFSRRLADIEGAPSRIHAWSPTVADIAVQLSAAFASLRVLQNDVWGICAAATGAIGFPASLHDSYNKMVRTSRAGEKRPSWLAPISPPLRQALASYWEDGGRQVTAYRDVDQHFDVLARGCFLDMKADVFSRLWICLPDNPEVKAPGLFRYEHEIDAISFCRRSFEDLHALVERVAAQHAHEDAPLQRAIEFQPPIVHENGVRRTTALLLLDRYGSRAVAIGQTEDKHVQVRQLGD
jgi:hypothetical protein